MPYAPSVNNVSGQIFGASLSQSIDAILKGAEKGEEKRSQRKRAETILSAMYPDRKDEFSGMSLDQLQGTLDHVTVERANELLELHRRESARADVETGLHVADFNRRAAADEQRQHMFAGEQSALRAAVAPPMVDRLATVQAPGRGMLAGGLPAPSAAEAGLRGDRYIAAGGVDPQVIETLARLDAAGARQRGAAWMPQVVDAGGGTRVLMTSPSSAVPLRDAAAGSNAGGPEYSQDGKFYRSGPRDAWHPIAAAREDPVTAAKRSGLQSQLAALAGQIAEDEQAIAAGDNRYGAFNYASRKSRIDESRARLAALQAQLDALGPSTGSGQAPSTGAADGRNLPSANSAMSNDDFFKGL